MHIWVIGRGLPSENNGMLGSFELEQAQMLANAGNSVCYFAMSVRSGNNLKHIGYHYETKEKVRILSFNFPLGRLLSVEKTDKIFTRSFRKMAQLTLREYGVPDIVHVHYPAQRPYLPFFELQKLGSKIVATEHWTKVYDKTINNNSKNNLNDFCKFANSVICVSSGLRQAIIDITQTKREIIVVPNVVQSTFVKTKEAHTGFRFVAAGRLVQHKQFDKIVEAFIHQFHNERNVSLTVAGNGDQYKHILSIIQEAHMEKRIKLLGTISRENMAGLISSSDALISFSRLETFCVPVVEAWMCGLPTIVPSTIPVAMDHHDERLGIYVNCNDITSLEQALGDIIDQYDNYDSLWISNYAKNNFGEESITSKLLDIYSSL